jgi:hypothetical protein
VQVAPYDLQLVSKYISHATEPLTRGSDDNSSSVVSGWNWIFGHPVNAGRELENCLVWETPTQLL